MKPKHLNDSLPPTPWVFYVKLYCNRKDRLKSKYNKRNLIEATKSWLSLSESEKQQFNTKYKEYEQKYIMQCGEQLKNAKPFMKIKNIERMKGINSTNENLKPDNNIEPESMPMKTAHIDTQIEGTSEQVTFEESSPHPATHNIFEEHIEEHFEDILEGSIHNNDEAPEPVLIEPLAPTIKSGHELFLMLNSTNEDTWASLPQIEKSRYSRAVSIMKKYYISKYKEYLESLSPKDLFDYYNRTIF